MQAFFISVLIIFLSSCIVFGRPQKEPTYEKIYYEIVKIEKGDTVWEIAQRFQPKGMPMNE